MKIITRFKMTIVMTIALFFIGILASSWIIKSAEIILDRSVVATSPWELFLFRMSIGILFSLCAVSTRILFTVYSKVRIVHSPTSIFLVGFAISIISIAIGIAFNLVYIRSTISFLNKDILVGVGTTNYLTWGSGTLAFICAIIIILLARFSPKKF